MQSTELQGLSNTAAAAATVPVVAMRAVLVRMMAGEVELVAAVASLASAVATALEAGHVMGSGTG